MSETRVEAPSGPWWKYPHMWMVVGGPAVVVVAAFVTLYLAVSRPDPVYTDAPAGRSAAAQQPADEQGSTAHAPAMQARNHAATGVVPGGPRVSNAPARQSGHP